MVLPPTSGIDTVRSFYASLAEGRFADAFALVSADSVIREPADLPFGGDYHGTAGQAELLQKIGAVIDLGIVSSTICDAGTTFAVKLLARFTPRQGGDPLDLEILELITVRAGQIVEIDVYHKTPSAVSAIWQAG